MFFHFASVSRLGVKWGEGRAGRQVCFLPGVSPSQLAVLFVATFTAEGEPLREMATIPCVGFLSALPAVQCTHQFPWMRAFKRVLGGLQEV